MSPVGTIFLLFPLKTGTNLLHPLPPSIVERVFRGIFWLKIFLETIDFFSRNILDQENWIMPSAVDTISSAVRTHDCVLCCTHTRTESHKRCSKSLDANVCGRTAVLAGMASC